MPARILEPAVVVRDVDIAGLWIGPSAAHDIALRARVGPVPRHLGAEELGKLQHAILSKPIALEADISLEGRHISYQPSGIDLAIGVMVIAAICLLPVSDGLLLGAIRLCQGLPVFLGPIELVDIKRTVIAGKIGRARILEERRAARPGAVIAAARPGIFLIAIMT